jgi:hypothetical protein
MGVKRACQHQAFSEYDNDLCYLGPNVFLIPKLYRYHWLTTYIESKSREAAYGLDQSAKET